MQLIHRYLLERYYFGDKKTRDKLLPQQYHGMDVNLIVPEDSNNSDKTYRADLSIYFKKSDKRIPIEVKWVARELTKANQIKHLKSNGGFVVSFENGTSTSLSGIPAIEINYDDFRDWMSSNVSKLTRESITEKTGGKFTNFNQNWLVFLRGENAKENFQRMLRRSPASPFWAFRQDKTALANILNMRRGDKCLFLFGKGLKQGQGYSSHPDKEFLVENFYTTEIVKPYYMVLDFEKGTFFEEKKNKKLPINRRSWLHFVNFRITSSLNSERRIKFGKQGKLGSALANSTNFGGGTPVQLSAAEYEGLVDRLKFLESK